VLRRAAIGLLALPLAGAVLAGCGFVGASGVSHTKPNGFVLRGRVTAPAAGVGPQVDGTSCTSTVPDLAAGVPVKVSDADGHELADGQLGAGVLVTVAGRSGASCDFPFQITAVPGGVSRYAVSVAGRPGQVFAATQLREDQQAVIVLTS
jgi:hypothetical protein